MNQIFESICSVMVVLALSSSLMISTTLRVKTLYREQEMGKLMHAKSLILYYLQENDSNEISAVQLNKEFPEWEFTLSSPSPNIVRVHFSYNHKQNVKGASYYVDVERD